MTGVKTYRRAGFILAEKVLKSRRVVTRTGVVTAREGSYIVHENGRVRVMSADEFEAEFEEVSQQEEDARTFTPAGKTVEEVIKFMRENPDEVTRVKILEKQGGERKTILEF